MKRKFLAPILAAVASVCCAFGLSACGEEKDEHEHSYGEWKTTLEATCTTEGTKEKECACGEKQTESIDALGHDFKNYVSDGNTTCTENGTQTATCSRCDATDVKPEEKFGHDFKNYVSDGNTTCTENGTQTATCSHCDATDVKPEEKFGHDFKNYVSDGNTTCTENGTQSATCSRCDATDVKPKEKFGHDIKHHEAKTATCDSVGWNAYDNCTRCDYTTYQEIPKTQHDFADYICKICNGIDPELPDSQGLEYELNEDGISYSVCGLGTATETPILKIPAEYNGKPVTAVADESFMENDTLTIIWLPDSITYVGAFSFNLLFKVKAIRLPQNLTEISDGAFIGCDQIETLKIPDGITKIGNWAFNGCALKTVYIPASVTEIGQGAFCGPALEEIILEEGVKNYVLVDGILFNKDKSLLLWYPHNKTQTTYEIPESVTAIGSYAFSYCPFTDIVIPDGITVIEEGLFYGSENLTEITIPASVTKIAGEAFTDCDNIKTVIYKGTKDEWKAINNQGFSFCSSNFTVQCTDGKLDKHGNEIAE